MKSSLTPMQGETTKGPLGRNDPLPKLTRRILYAVVLSRSPVARLVGEHGLRRPGQRAWAASPVSAAPRAGELRLPPLVGKLEPCPGQRARAARRRQIPYLRFSPEPLNDEDSVACSAVAGKLRPSFGCFSQIRRSQRRPPRADAGTRRCPQSSLATAGSRLGAHSHGCVAVATRTSVEAHVAVADSTRPQAGSSHGRRGSHDRSSLI
jgi:hypothetical protein